MEVFRAAGATGRDADRLRVGVAQIASVWLAHDATLERAQNAAAHVREWCCNDGGI